MMAVIMLVTAVLGVLIPADRISAADAYAAFGSTSYEVTEGKEFKVGVYVKCMDGVGACSMTVGYDPNCLEYVEGGSGYDAANGLVFLVDETGNGANSRKFLLKFRAKTACYTSIYAVANYAYTYAFPDVILEDGTVVPAAPPVECTITRDASAPITIQAVAAPEPEKEEKPEDAVEETVSEEEDTVSEEETIETDTVISGEDIASGETAGDEDRDYHLSGSVQIDIPEDIDDIEVIQVEPTNIYDANPQVFATGDNPEPVRTDYSVLLAIVLVISAVSLILLLWLSRDEFKARKKEAQQYIDELENPHSEDEYIYELPEEGEVAPEDDGLYEKPDEYYAVSQLEEPADVQAVNETSEIADQDSEETDIDYTPISDSYAEDEIQFVDVDGMIVSDERERVISVKDVTMEFHLSTYNPSGLKDYLIQAVKRKIEYRRLFALYHVSFDVYKGEVVGIIGTNGSGKSTLLKIVSGALRPTSGKVIVDRKKVQLLTLGTGFDMELTARENVYLNGSIIGYSKEFLDKHYKDIVEFAELQDFMEEKVKNFSSGMVSRLGFAIATAGDAAEILILDEVLSVGDEFFRKKSLARIKEMIHGGSTVLIVSHSIGTILDNCTKCVWIEKGELRMVGNPKEVCEAYRHMEEENVVGA
jgi:ABC-type polysaccharide/polyol phosphate transport system ATPase subunit